MSRVPVIRDALQTPRSCSPEFDARRVRSGLPPLYGSLLDDSLKPSPIEDEAHVDQRRKAMGLEPLADYLKRSKQNGPDLRAVLS